MNGKGSKSRITDKKRFDANYNTINWNDDYIICNECGQSHKRKDKNLKMKQDITGDWVCKNCNFN